MDIINKKEFMKLPDWKKIKLKSSKPMFHNYPVMTMEQELDRQDFLYTIAAHFTLQSTEDAYSSLGNNAPLYIPRYIWQFLTPRLLDCIDSKLIFEQVGFCAFCKFFNGHKTHIRNKRKKVLCVSGKCKLKDNKQHKSKDFHKFTFVSPKYRCYAWYPNKFHKQYFEFKIFTYMQQKATNYNKIDYFEDLKSIPLWDYFFNSQILNILGV